MRTSDSEPAQRNRALLALLLLVPVPSLGVVMAGIVAEGPLGQTVFLIAKAWVVLFPVTWLVLVDRKRPVIPRPRREGMAAACISGALIFLAIALGYWFIGRDLVDVESMQDKIREVGLGTPLRYLVGAVGWIGFNSLMEEYVWRWFVVTRCEALMPRKTAIAASALFFTLHHAIALEIYFDWQITVLGSLGVFVGGATWSWLYVRYRNIWAAYVSHVFADVIVFAIGWQLVFG